MPSILKRPRPHIINEPRLGEIRLQWWREVLASGRRGAQDPVSAALLATIAANRLPVSAAGQPDRGPALISITIHALDNDLEGYCGETCSVLFRLSAAILATRDRSRAKAIADASGHAALPMR
jgi:phytoene synthase